MSSNRLSDRGFTASRGLSYTFTGTATEFDAALPLSHGLGALPGALELWIEVSAGQWEQHDPATYVTASTTALTTTGTTLTSVVGGATNVRLVAAAGAVAVSVEEASLTKAGIVSTGAQSFAGVKTFAVDPTFTSGSQLVTTDTQTIDGAKTFTSSPEVKLSSPKLTLSDTRDLGSGGWTDGLELGNWEVRTEDASGIGPHTVAFIKAVTQGTGVGTTPRVGLAFGVGQTNAAATEAIRIDPAGNVGIGTSSPGAGLDVFEKDIRITHNDTVNTHVLEWWRNGAQRGRVGFDFSQSRLQVQADGVIQFLTNGENVNMTIGPTGAVTLGPSGSSSTSLQHVLNLPTANSYSSIASTSTATLRVAADANGTPIISARTTTNNVFGMGFVAGTADTNSASDMYWQIIENDNTNHATLTSDAYRWYNGGGQIILKSTRAGAWTLGATTTSAAHLAQSNSADLAFEIRNLNNNLRADGLKLYLANSNISTGALAGTAFLRCFNSTAGETENSNERMVIRTDGNVYNVNNVFAATSDASLKTNITDARNYLEDLCSLRLVTYNRIDDPGFKQLGLIAQEVEQVFPALVEGEEGSKSVKYSIINLMMLKAIQELHAELQAAKDRITQLEGAN